MFNKILCYDKKPDANKITGQLSIVKKSIYVNRYFNEVINLYKNTKWEKLFGLNFTETLKLDFYTYNKLKKVLIEVSELELEKAEKTEKEYSKIMKSNAKVKKSIEL